MKDRLKNFTLFIISVFFLFSCGELNEEVEKRLNQLDAKADSLDSMINKEVDKVSSLDSLIDKESNKVKKLDSIINKTSEKIDSISKKRVKILENFKN